MWFTFSSNFIPDFLCAYATPLSTSFIFPLNSLQSSINTRFFSLISFCIPFFSYLYFPASLFHSIKLSLNPFLLFFQFYLMFLLSKFNINYTQAISSNIITSVYVPFYFPFILVYFQYQILFTLFIPIRSILLLIFHFGFTFSLYNYVFSYVWTLCWLSLIRYFHIYHHYFFFDISFLKHVLIHPMPYQCHFFAYSLYQLHTIHYPLLFIFLSFLFLTPNISIRYFIVSSMICFFFIFLVFHAIIYFISYFSLVLLNIYFFLCFWFCVYFFSLRKE